MNIRAWVSAVRDSFKSITRSPIMSLASMATVAVSLLVLAVIMLLAVNLEYMASTVEGQVEVRAYFCVADEAEDADKPQCENGEPTEQEKQELLNAAKGLPGVQAVTFVSKEVAWQQMKEQHPEYEDIYSGFEDDGMNPLHDTLVITATDPDQVKSVAARMSEMSGISDVNYGQDFVDNLLTFTRAVRVGGIALVIMLVVATVLTLSNTIRLSVYARRREIAIMKLVGATNWYIRRPFIVEGVLLGVIGALLAMALTGWGYSRLVSYIYVNIPFLPIISPKNILWDLTGGLILLGVLLGTVGSIVSMRRFLKV